MLRKGKNNPNIGQVRKHVEKYFGRGMASAKLTTNPKTMDKIVAQKTKYSTKKEPSVINFPGSHINKGRKQFVYVEKVNQQSKDRKRLPIYEIEATLAHELTHAAYSRLKSQLKRKEFKLQNEVIASTIQLEYLKEHYPVKYKKTISDYKSNSNLNLHPSSFGLKISHILHKNFSKNQRKNIIQQLINSKAQNINGVLRVILKNLKLVRNVDKSTIKEIEDFLRKK